jgi:hypothetical protein
MLNNLTKIIMKKGFLPIVLVVYLTLYFISTSIANILFALVFLIISIVYILNIQKSKLNQKQKNTRTILIAIVTIILEVYLLNSLFQ